MNSSSIETVLETILAHLEQLEKWAGISRNTLAEDRARARAELQKAGVYTGDPEAEVTAPPFIAKDIPPANPALVNETLQQMEKDRNEAQSTAIANAKEVMRLRYEMDVMRAEIATRGDWIRRMNNILGYGPNSDPDSHTIAIRLNRIKQSAKDLIYLLRKIHDDPQYQAVWVTAAQTLGAYIGPKYDEQMNELWKAIESLMTPVHPAPPTPQPEK